MLYFMIFGLILFVLIAAFFGGMYYNKKNKKGGNITVDNDMNNDIPDPIEFDDY